MSDLTPVPAGGSAPPAGPTTSEFWVSTLTAVISLIVCATELFKVGFDPSGLQTLVPAIALIAAAVTSAVYTHSRATVKAAHATAAAAASLGVNPASMPEGRPVFPAAVPYQGLRSLR